VAPPPSIAVVVNLQPSPASARACESAAPASQARPNFREEIKERSRATAQFQTHASSREFVGRPFWKCEHARRGDTCKLCVGEEEAKKVRARERRERLKREETDKDAKGRIVAAAVKREETDKVRMLTKDAEGRIVAAAVKREEADKVRVLKKDAEGRVAAAAVEHREEITGKEKAHIKGEEADIQRLDATGHKGEVVPGDRADETAMKVTELKLALKAQGLPTSGLKADLVQRLKSALERLQSKTQAGVAPSDSSKKRARQDTEEEVPLGEGNQVRDTAVVPLPTLDAARPPGGGQERERGTGQERERENGQERHPLRRPLLAPSIPPCGNEPGDTFCKICFGPCFHTRHIQLCALTHFSPLRAHLAAAPTSAAETPGLVEQASNVVTNSRTIQSGVRSLLDECYARGVCRPEDLDDRLLQGLAALPEADGIAALGEFMRSDMSQIRNKSAYFSRVISRFKGGMRERDRERERERETDRERERERERES